MELTEAQIKGIIEFMKVANVPKATITALTTEPGEDEEAPVIKDLGLAYNDDRKEFYGTEAVEAAKKGIGDKSVSGARLSDRKKLAKAYNMTKEDGTPLSNKDLEAYGDDNDKFFADLKTFQEKKVKSLDTDAVKTLKKENEKLLESNTTLTADYEALQAKVPEIEAAADARVADHQNRIDVGNAFDAMTKADIKANKCIDDEWKIRKIKQDVIERVRIVDGKIVDLEGNSIKHPTQDIRIETLDQLWQIEKEDAKMIPESNAGKLPASYERRNQPTERKADTGASQEDTKRISSKLDKLANKQGYGQ